ncbi:MAG: GDYXXLXY domain-containing protein [Hyphomicrobiales bacterium]|nr:GDYXXLXY domain-containing protein [Hyphomicrobiales bacterium]
MKLSLPQNRPLPSLDGLINRVPPGLRASLAALILSGLLLAMIKERADILRSGAEVRLATAPIDPRDLFRGDYVVLSYDISQVQAAKLGEPGDFKRGEPVFVVLQANAEGWAEAVAVSRTFPKAGPGRVVIEGKAAGGRFCRPVPGGTSRTCAPDELSVRVIYGLESFFVPQGHGRNIERTERLLVEVVAAVSASGKAAIKRLLIDGKPVYDEPPY